MVAQKVENNAKKRAILFISIGVIVIAASAVLWLFTTRTVQEDAPENQAETLRYNVAAEELGKEAAANLSVRELLDEYELYYDEVIQ